MKHTPVLCLLKIEIELNVCLQPCSPRVKTQPLSMLVCFSFNNPIRYLTGLTDWLAEPDLAKIVVQPTKLISVNHKVVMEMAPEGTQYPSSSATQSHLLFHVNRPFLYLVRDEASGALLFIGRVLNPKDLRK